MCCVLCAVAKHMRHLLPAPSPHSFQITDHCFIFDVRGDGRPRVDRMMLKAMRVLDLTDCARLTDATAEMVGRRCDLLESLKLQVGRGARERGGGHLNVYIVRRECVLQRAS